MGSLFSARRATPDSWHRTAYGRAHGRADSDIVRRLIRLGRFEEGGPHGLADATLCPLIGVRRTPLTEKGNLALRRGLAHL
jgi:hypothetical protein